MSDCGSAGHFLPCRFILSSFPLMPSWVGELQFFSISAPQSQSVKNQLWLSLILDTTFVATNNHSPPTSKSSSHLFNIHPTNPSKVTISGFSWQLGLLTGVCCFGVVSFEFFFDSFVGLFFVHSVFSSQVVCWSSVLFPWVVVALSVFLPCPQPQSSATNTLLSTTYRQARESFVLLVNALSGDRLDMWCLCRPITSLWLFLSLLFFPLAFG